MENHQQFKKNCKENNGQYFKPCCYFSCNSNFSIDKNNKNNKKEGVVKK